MAGVMLLVLVQDGCIELTNRYGCEILGRDEEDLLGDPGIRKKLGALLVRSKQATKSFASGGKFLEKLESMAPGCLIVGQNLPDQTGLEFMAEQQHRGYSFPRILLSQKTNVSTAVRAIREGPADFVEIPWIGPKTAENSR